MGYSTDFEGVITIEPPLNPAEFRYLLAFARTRHMHREQGPFYVEFESNTSNEFSEVGVYNTNIPPPGQPSLWCDIEPSEDGTKLFWNGSEKTYEFDKWVDYLITRFLKPGAIASESNMEYFKEFTFNHVCNGEIIAQGESIKDRWMLKVINNKVTKRKLK